MGGSLLPHLPDDSPFLIFCACDNPVLDAASIEQIERALRHFQYEHSEAVRSWFRVHQPDKMRHVFIVILAGNWVDDEDDVHCERAGLKFFLVRNVKVRSRGDAPISLSEIRAAAAPDVQKRLRAKLLEHQSYRDAMTLEALQKSDEAKGV